ncbi:MAG: serine/threonine protein kinase [Saccharothrix sp.]|nr:serine/threonine protein kinase [Saccharothrix sp.]
MSPSVLVDRYQLLEPIGIGGMAEVHRAWDTVLRRHVAVKLCQPGFDPAAAKRFDQEVHALAGLTHPALVSVYDADTGADPPFVVLRLIEGRTLRDRLDLGPLPAPEVRALGARLADALAHVHAHGLVHRDVKPSNILLDGDGDAYLTDFGLAHLTGATRMTRTNDLVGTAAYLAPEQVLGGEVDHPTDVYALGLVLLECLTGRLEYPGGNVEAAVARLHRPPAVPEDVPPDLRRLVARMTASTPAERPTARACARLLDQDPDADDPTVRLSPPPTPARRSWRPVVVVAAALAGAFAITTAAAPGDNPSTTTPPVSTEQATPANPAQPAAATTDQAASTTTSQPPASTEQADATPTNTPNQAANVPDAAPTTNPPPTTTLQPTDQPTTEPPTTAPSEPTVQPTEGENPADPEQAP